MDSPLLLPRTFFGEQKFSTFNINICVQHYHQPAHIYHGQLQMVWNFINLKPPQQNINCFLLTNAEDREEKLKTNSQNSSLPILLIVEKLYNLNSSRFSFIF